MVRISDIHDYIISYIETNKEFYKIDFVDSIESIKELLEEIEKEYENIKEDIEVI